MTNYYIHKNIKLQQLKITTHTNFENYAQIICFAHKTQFLHKSDVRLFSLHRTEL